MNIPDQEYDFRNLTALSPGSGHKVYNKSGIEKDLLRNEFQLQVFGFFMQPKKEVEPYRMEKIFTEIPKQEGSAYHLKWPIKVVIERNEDLVLATNEDLDLLAYGATEDECLNNFFSMFDDMKQHYTGIAENKIIGLAVRLKALFTSITE